MSEPFRVLGIYHPSRWRGRVIGKELTAFTAKLGLRPLKATRLRLHKGALWRSRKLHADVVNHTNPHSEAVSWHQDGDLTSGFNMNCGIVLWTNRTPTEIKVGGKVLRPKPFEVVLIRNLACHHRQPSDVPKRRWLFRQRVEL